MTTSALKIKTDRLHLAGSRSIKSHRTPGWKGRVHSERRGQVKVSRGVGMHF